MLDIACTLWQNERTRRQSPKGITAMTFRACGFLLVMCCVPAIHADERLPIPDEAAQKEAAALVQELFGQEVEAAKTPDQKSALVKSLLQEASQPDASPAGRYALLQVALDNAPDASIAVTVIDEMAKHFQIDTLRQKAAAVWRMSKEARTSPQRTAVAEVALQLADESVKRDAYDPALKLADIALNAAQKAKDRNLEQKTRAMMLEVRKSKVAFDRMQEAMAVLEKDPTNAEANLKVGTYKCLVKGDWGSGLPMLALGGNKALEELARQELSQPRASNEQVALADGWFNLAKESDDADKDRMLQRAGYWYELALQSQPPLSRLVRAKVEKRLKEVEDIADAGQSQPSGRKTKQSFTDADIRKLLTARPWKRIGSKRIVFIFVFRPDGTCTGRGPGGVGSDWSIWQVKNGVLGMGGDRKSPPKFADFNPKDGRFYFRTEKTVFY